MKLVINRMFSAKTLHTLVFLNNSYTLATSRYVISEDNYTVKSHH